MTVAENFCLGGAITAACAGVGAVATGALRVGSMGAGALAGAAVLPVYKLSMALLRNTVLPNRLCQSNTAARVMRYALSAFAAICASVLLPILLGYTMTIGAVAAVDCSITAGFALIFLLAE
ncbi:MAG: hypothetical protein ACHQT8_04445 [Chlamydiales bacterium]